MDWEKHYSLGKMEGTHLGILPKPQDVWSKGPEQGWKQGAATAANAAPRNGSQ